MAVLRSVVNTIESTAKGDPRCLLGQSPWRRGLEDGGIEIPYAQCETVGCEFSPQQTDPFPSIKVCVAAIMLGGSYDPLFNPLNRDLPERNEIILAIDFGKFGIKGNVHAKPGKRFEITAQCLRGGVQDAVRAFGIIETIAEGSIRSCERPIWWFPRVRAAAYAEDGAVGIDAE